jgi:hypothetical protein
VRAMTIGKLDLFSPGELERCVKIIGVTTGLTRSWDYWAQATKNRRARFEESREKSKGMAKLRRR